jgi:hypothetical protein
LSLLNVTVGVATGGSTGGFPEQAAASSTQKKTGRRVRMKKV